jgi:hypothetical protein
VDASESSILALRAQKHVASAQSNPDCSKKGAAVVVDQTLLSISDILLIIEGLSQTWTLLQDASLTSAKRLARLAETAVT